MGVSWGEDMTRHWIVKDQYLIFNVPLWKEFSYARLFVYNILPTQKPLCEVSLGEKQNQAAGAHLRGFLSTRGEITHKHYTHRE